MRRDVMATSVGVVLAAAMAVVVTAGMGGPASGTSATAPVKVAGPGSVPAPPLERAGGETCATATVIASLPYTDSGATTGAVNDYDFACPYTGSTAPDVVYSYTPVANQTVLASLCTPGTNTSYDTKLYVYATTCSGTPVGCNDDSCSSPLYSNYVSQLEVALTAGTTYYFVVDGYGTASGNYTLHLEEYVPPVCPCPATPDLDEGALDPNCGLVAPDPTGGCNSDAASPGPYMVQISCNTTICGTVGAAGESRDTDWFELVLPVADTIRVTMTSTDSLLLFDLSGEYDCANVAVAQNFPQDACGGTGEMVIAGVAGPNWIWVGPSVFDGIACGTQYTMTVTCDTVPVDLQHFVAE